MEGNAHHGFLQQEDVNYDDLMNNAAWPVSAGDQFSFPQSHPVQDPYQRYTTSQPSFNQYQQPAYAVPFSNPPYTSQYQHATPSDVFGPASYNVDPSSMPGAALYHGPESSFSFPPESATISPHSLQYNMPSNQPIHGGVSNVPFQQPTNSYSQRPPEQSTVFFHDAQNGNMQQDNPIRYPTLPNGSMDYMSKQSVKRPREGDASSTPSTPSAPSNNPPAQQTKVEQTKVEPDRKQPRITNPELLTGPPRFEHAPYIVWSDTPVYVPPGLKSTVPKYHPRTARSGQDLIPGFDISRISTPARVSSATKKIRAPKEKKLSVSKYKGTSQGPRQAIDRSTSLHGNGESLGTSSKSPSTPTESSSSEEESSSEESEYEDDEEMPVKDISEVRAPTRPSDVAAAAGWDAIGIVWKDPNSNPSADVVKGAIEEYGAFVGALRLQLKANSTKTEEAAQRPAEVDKLKQARRVLLDSLYETINAANTLGYGAIVENLGGHEKLVHGLTTTLIECIKTEDFLGKLPKAIFSLLAKFQTMTEALLKKLRFDSIQKRWNKKGDEQIKKDIASILANTTDAKDRAAKAKKEAVRAEEDKKVLDKIDQAKARSSETVKTASNVTSTKRPHEGDSNASKPNKKFASDVSGTPASTSKSVPPKRPTNLLANNLLGITSKPAPKPAPKKREPSPPGESKLGAILASIAKPPEPPKAPEAPPRPPETPEEKQRRERKESRRHLRVKFKEGPELEEIRLFKHEQAEDEGRQDDMLRDAHDDRSEGMMHKKRVSEKMDAGLEDDESLPGDIEERPYPDLVLIDFSELDKATLFGPTYVTRGGDKTFTTPEQQTQERREALELMVIYTDPNDIPPSAKEPPQDSTALQQERELRGPTEPWIVQRLKEIQQYGPDYAIQIFLRRNEEQRFKEIRENRARGIATSAGPPSANISSILQQLGGDPATSQLSHQQNLSQKPTTTMDPKALENLVRIVESLKGKPYPATEPPDWMTSETQRAEWWEGYNRDKAANQRKASGDQMAQVQAAQFQPQPMLPTQIHQQMSTQQMQSFPMQAPQPNIASIPELPNDVAQQVQAYLAGFANNGNNNGSAYQQYNFTGWPSSNGPGQGEWENEQLQARPKQTQDNHSSDGNQRGFDSQQWNGGFGNDGLFDENGEYKGKKKPCKFWGQGKCAKGAKCTFLHDGEN